MKTILLYIDHTIDAKIRRILAKDTRPYLIRETKHGFIEEAMKTDPEDIRVQAATADPVMHETGNSMRVQVTEEVHAEQKQQAEMLGVTLNTLINLKLAHYATTRTGGKRSAGN